MPSQTVIQGEQVTPARSNENIFLFIPNLIGKFAHHHLFFFEKINNTPNVGYTRIILASLSLYYMPWHPKVCVSLYCISCLLDAVDGNAARYYNQCEFVLRVRDS
jgi:CDP-diacylglycerol--inositol 3-phosphatidyltransferase